LIYLKLGHHLPWLYLSPYYEQYDDEYASNLFRISTHGDWDRWVEFCLNGTIRQARDSISRCERLNGLLTDYYKRITAPSTRTETIIRQLFKNPIVNIPEVRKICGNIAHNTAQRDIDRLVGDGILSPLGTRRPRSYYAREIWAIAYSDMGEADNADADSESEES